MEKIVLLLICGVSKVCVVNCAPTRKHESGEGGLEQKFIVTKANRVSGDANYEDQRKYEQLQNDDYLNNRERYEKWPQMDLQQMRQLCNKYIQKIFRRSQKLETTPEIISQLIPLTYRIIEDGDKKAMTPVTVSVFQCHVPNSYRRKYLHFIRGPRPHCLFLLKPLHCNWTRVRSCKDMVIVNELCVNPDKDGRRVESSHANAQGQGGVSRDALRKRLERKNDEANSLLRTFYERVHFNYYNLKPGDCQTWPELKYVDKVLFCRIYLQKILGTSVINEVVQPEVREFERLIYMTILNESTQDSIQSIVTVLQCNVPKARKRKRSLFQFIKSNTSNCVFLVKPTARNLPQEFVIVNVYCVGIQFHEKFLSNLKPKL